MTSSWLTPILSARHKPLITLITVPACIALVLGLIPIGLLPFETDLRSAFGASLISVDSMDRASHVLTTIATGSITALSLTYSLVLLIFTQATSNLGPRLLRRFSTDVVNQITAGILGGTFLYCIIALYWMKPDVVPKITTTGAVLFAILAVFHLIYFIRHVAETITIDEEISKISKSLQVHIGELADRHQEEQQVPDESEALEGEDITAHRTGYIGQINLPALLQWAQDNELVIHFTKAQGTFVHKDATIARLCSTANERPKDIDPCPEQLIEIDNARSEGGAIPFEINLLVEIALRALSPSVSDTFTAIACLDSLSSAFDGMLRRDIQLANQADSEGNIRIILEGMQLSQLIGQVFHPIRRAGGDNILMARAIASALERLSHLDNDDVQPLIAQHGTLLLKQLEKHDLLEEDLESVRELLPQAVMAREQAWRPLP